MPPSDYLPSTEQLLADLIRFPSISAASNLDIIHYIRDYLDGFGAESFIDYDSTGQKANIFATLGPKIDGGIVLSGHSDVVPVAGQPWSLDPFTMVKKDGALYGRGSCDMKGFIAATLAMVPYYARLNLQRPLHFSFTYDEEEGCLGAAQLVLELQKRSIRPSIAIIGEPTNMGIIEGHKGCYEYAVEFTGLAGHGSQPDKGVSAAEYAARYVVRLLELREKLKTNPPQHSIFEPPWTTLQVGRIAGGEARNVIADKCLVDWEMRPVTKSDADFVKEEIDAYCTDELIPAMQKVHRDATINTTIIAEVEGFEPVAQNTAKTIVAELTGQDQADVVSFCTEAGIFQSIGMDAIICGPGSIDQAHKADEFVTIEQIESCLSMLYKIGEKVSTP